MLEVVAVEKEEKYIRDFLLLPKRLYDRKKCTQNEREEEELLRRSHVLSKYFDVRGILIYQDQDPVARCLVTLYPGDDNAYVGFFECIQDEGCAKVLFQAAKQIAREEHRVQIVGPVNASFWIGYRMKTDRFDQRPYFGELYNLPYYPDLFRGAGYVETERYTSNLYDRMPLFISRNTKTARRYREFLVKGYTFVSPDPGTIDKNMREIYSLITELYRFPDL